MTDNIEQRGVTQRRIDWSAAHSADWERAIQEGDRKTARDLYEEFGQVLREEMREEGGNPVLSDPGTNRLIRRRLTEIGTDHGIALDLGCGPTPVAAMTLDDLGLRAIGLDVAHSICAIAEETTGGSVKTVVADAEHLPFRDGVFDVVTCDDTIEHIFDQPAAAAELGRTVRPGGRLLVVTPNASGLHVLMARGKDLLRRNRRPRSSYHITQSHVKELRWHELLKLFKPWFDFSFAEAITFGGGPRAKWFNRFVNMPGGWRVGWTLFVELERQAIDDGPQATQHYAELDEPDSQTSPDVVGYNLRNWLDSAEIDGPVLDLGTGLGTNLQEIVKRRRVFGADVSVAALRTARGIAPVVACDAARLPFRDGVFGAVVCTEVLEHVDDPAPVLEEAARVLGTSGQMYVTTPNYINTAGLHKLIADKRSGKHDWNPWGAHEGGYEAFMTGRKLWSSARNWFQLESVRGLDFGQAMTGRFKALDKAAWSRGGQAVLRRVLPRIEGASGPLGWLGMHTELVLRKR